MSCYCPRCGAFDEKASRLSEHRCKTLINPPAQEPWVSRLVTDTQSQAPVTPSVTDRRRKWEATNAEKHRKQSADRMRKRRAEGKA